MKEKDPNQYASDVDYHATLAAEITNRYPTGYDYFNNDFDIKKANPGDMEKWLPFAIVKFTEKEIADILRYAWAINLAPTKAEKLACAQRVVQDITPWLWKAANDEEKYTYHQRRAAEVLFRKLESYAGLTSLITYAGVR